jgi:hypothetical protein
MVRFLLVILTLLPIGSFSQVMIFGTVVDKSSQAPVPYATIGFIKKNAGTNADEKGKFILEVPMADPDTLFISSVGYESLKISVQDARVNSTIALEKKVRPLAPVTVISKDKWEYATINKPDRGIMGMTTSGFVTQMGQLLTAPAENCQLLEIELRMNGTSFESNKSKFRLRIYLPDSISGKPSEEICDGPIDVDSDSKVVKIDLSDRKIFIPGSEFIVAVEWLKIPYNEDNRGPKKYGKVTVYRPSICFKNVSDQAMRMWLLTYQGIWLMQKGCVLAIGARVRW